MNVRQRAAFFESNPATTPRPRLENASQESSEHGGPIEENSSGWRGRPKSVQTVSATCTSDIARRRESSANERTPIVMIGNAEVEDRPAFPDRATSLALVKTSSALELERRSSEKFWENLQKQTTKTLSPDETGRKLSNTFNPVATFFKDNAEKIAVATRPALATAGRGFETVQTSVMSLVDKTSVPAAFQKSADDLSDLASRLAFAYDGSTGVCTKCRKLPVDLPLSNSPANASQSELKWAFSLSHIIYHAGWCKFVAYCLECFTSPLMTPCSILQLLLTCSQNSLA